jgi:hypothetical protein
MTVKLWDTKNVEACPNWKDAGIRGPVNERKPVAFSPDGTLLAYISPGASVTLSNVHNKAP